MCGSETLNLEGVYDPDYDFDKVKIKPLPQPASLADEEPKYVDPTAISPLKS